MEGAPRQGLSAELSASDHFPHCKAYCEGVTFLRRRNRLYSQHATMHML